MEKLIAITFKGKKYYISKKDFLDKSISKLFAYEDKDLTKLAKRNGMQLLFLKKYIVDKLKENKIKGINKQKVHIKMKKSELIKIIREEIKNKLQESIFDSPDYRIYRGSVVVKYVIGKKPQADGTIFVNKMTFNRNSHKKTSSGTPMTKSEVIALKKKLDKESKKGDNYYKNELVVNKLKLRKNITEGTSSITLDNINFIILMNAKNGTIQLIPKTTKDLDKLDSNTKVKTSKKLIDKLSKSLWGISIWEVYDGSAGFKFIYSQQALEDVLLKRIK